MTDQNQQSTSTETVKKEEKMQKEKKPSRVGNILLLCLAVVGCIALTVGGVIIAGHIIGALAGFLGLSLFGLGRSAA